MKKLFLLGLGFTLLSFAGCAQKAAKKTEAEKPAAAAPTEEEIQVGALPAPTKSERAIRKEERRRQKMQSVIYNR